MKWYGPLSDDEVEDDDLASGTYILRSKLDHPAVNKSRDVIHNISVTGDDGKARIGNSMTEHIL